jgi:hypothetical protein
MNKKALLPVYTLLIAMIALIVAVAALVVAKNSRQIALSTITIEEGESFNQPIFDEEKNQYSYLILSELQVNNAGGPAVTLERLCKVEEGAGFFVALKGQAVQSADLQPRLFLLDQPLATYQENPRLLREKWGMDLGHSAELLQRLEPGAGKSIRYGICFTPYELDGSRKAEMALISLRLDFGNGRSQLFRRGYPIQPIKQ